MLSTLENIVNGLEKEVDVRDQSTGVTNKKTLKARELIKELLYQLENKTRIPNYSYKYAKQKGFEEFFVNMDDSKTATNRFLSVEDYKAKIEEQIGDFFLKQADILSYYIRYVQSIMAFTIQGKDQDQNSHHLELLRSQLSNFEMAILLYSSIKKKSYTVYVNKYDLLKGLEKDMFQNEDHLYLYAPYQDRHG